MPKVLLPLADGFEDIEAVTIIDVLRRAGIEVETAGLKGSIVTSKCGIRMHVESRIVDMETLKHDGIIIPGGKDAVETLMKSERMKTIVRLLADNGKMISAICMGPLLLAKLGILDDKRATIYPGLEKNLDRPRGDKVVVDGNIITSQGPGTAIDFSLAIVQHLLGKPTATKIKKHIVA
ncbi:MAG: DJ-1/PfpI family protein [Candidatus Aenigmarchaeota archaeon]|nr:DJ-1/PfpI family protein [Candidatus Aenigmarchaeota archaeon]